MARRIEDEIGRALMARRPAYGRSAEAKQRSISSGAAIELDSAPLPKALASMPDVARGRRFRAESTLSSAASRCD